MDPVDEGLALRVVAIFIAAAEEGLVHDDLWEHGHVDIVPAQQLLLLVELGVCPLNELAKRINYRLQVKCEVVVCDAECPRLRPEERLEMTQVVKGDREGRLRVGEVEGGGHCSC